MLGSKYNGTIVDQEKFLTSDREPGHDLHLKHEDPTIRFLHRVIRIAVKILAVLMVLVIVWGIGDVMYVLYNASSNRRSCFGFGNNILVNYKENLTNPSSRRKIAALRDFVPQLNCATLGV